MVGRTLICAAAGFGVLALTALFEISCARAEMPLTSKCNAVGNFSVDDRIAGCTAIIQAAGTSGSREEALKLFEQAAADCPRTFIEKPAADVELAALRASR
ncbi:hypothetical protein [Bradyrhizobium sp. STM 3566]|uniref:hypothetical protein n=1 Tax=Bradyrhizobium sp. STM 3566 TaxID=578928 RepID=UPI00388F60B2